MFSLPGGNSIIHSTHVLKKILYILNKPHHYLFRYPLSISIGLNAKRRYVWMHDMAFNEKEYTTTFLKSVDKSS
jgi:hypothetical protein